MIGDQVSKKRITAIIVTYNRLEKLKKTVKIISKENFTRIIIVNNGSVDGTAEWLESLNLKNLYIVNEIKNHGGAAGFAKGIEVASRDRSCSWIVCFDDDAWPSSDALKKFDALQLNLDDAAVAAAVYYPSGNICQMNRPGINYAGSFMALVIRLFKGKVSFAIEDYFYKNRQCVYVDYSSFVGLFLNIKLLHNASLGYPRKEFFIYGDDVEYTWRIRKLGFKILFCPEIKFIHDCSGGDKNISSWRIYYMIRNQILFYRTISGLGVFPLLLIFIFFRNVKYIFIGGKLNKLLFFGFFDGIRNKFDRNISLR